MKKIKKYGFFVVIVIVGILDLFYGMIIWYQKENFIKNGKKVTGHIYSISNHKKNKTIYFYYYINGKKYDQMLVVGDSKIKTSDPITIYYDPKNPIKISSLEKNHVEIIIIILGFLFVIFGSLLIFKTRKRE